MSFVADQNVPFLINGGAVRGRLVRLGASADSILAGHGYPLAVSTLLAETLALTAALAGALKYEGIFTLQTQSDGAVPMIVADVTSEGNLRGYARFDEDKLAAALKQEGAQVPRLLGEGYIAFTVDQGPDTDRYQGIVELEGATLSECANEYFRRSEQLETAIKLAARPAADGQGWQAAALMIQRMPVGGSSPIMTVEEADEVWNRAKILMDTASERELLDFGLASDQLLYRLYHAEQLVVHEPRGLQAKCRCSQERIESTMKSFPRDEVEELAEDNGEVAIVCEFCKTRYALTPTDRDRIYGAV